MGSDQSKKNGAQDVDVLGIEVVPGLTVAVKSAATVDVDVFASNLEKRGCVLEYLLEGIGLPVISIVCELDGSLNIWSLHQ